jgi:type IV secretory pathway VirB3-like protein
MSTGNLGAIETRKRMMFGAAMLALGVALTIAFFFLHASGPLLLVLFLPFWLGTLGLLQGRASM